MVSSVSKTDSVSLVTSYKDKRLNLPIKKEKEVFYTPLSSDVSSPITYPTYDLTQYLPIPSEPVMLANPNALIEAEKLEEDDLEKWVGRATELTSKIFSKFLSSIESFASKDNYSLLVSFSKESTVRATKSWFPGKIELYQLSKNPFLACLPWNFFKKMWYEGILTGWSEYENRMKIAELAPRIFYDRVQSISQKFDEKLEAVTKEAALILSDPTFADINALKDLSNRIQNVFDFYQTRMTPFSNYSGYTSTIKRVFVYLEKSLEEAKKSPWVFSVQERDMDEIRVCFADFSLKIGSLFSVIQKEAQKGFLDLKKLSDEVQEVREGIFNMIQKGYRLKTEIQKELQDIETLISSFEKRI